MGARVKAAAAGHFLTLDIRQYHLQRPGCVLMTGSERDINSGITIDYDERSPNGL